jgi:hypothetical protein
MVLLTQWYVLEERRSNMKGLKERKKDEEDG